MAMAHQSPWMNDELRLFRKTVRQFIQDKFVPHVARWRQQHRPDVEAWREAGGTGLLLASLPDTYGGGGGTFAHDAVVTEELARAGLHFGVVLQNIVAHHILAYGTEAQKQRWLPPLGRGELVGAIAMTEPAAGSDLQQIKTTARRTGDHFVVNGSKTFISNGWHAGLVCLAVKTDAAATPASLSMLVVETKDLAGFHVGAPFEKVGMHEQDTCEMFFDDVRVPVANLLGVEGQGFLQLMEQLPYERLTVGLGAVASAEQALAITTKYVKDRKAFGGSLMDLQHTRFTLAECHTEARVGRVFIDHCIQRYLARRLDAETAAMAKYWLTDRQCHIIDRCLQLHGGYGYMMEYPIARMWADARVQRIYAGANEVMKELIAWSL
jgi:acyl-CoA dehydrogenase